MINIATRRSLYDRVEPTDFQLTDRDVEIIRLVYKHRLLTTVHLQALTSSSSVQGLRKRLRYLFATKYLDRPKNQVFIRKYGEQKALVYALGNAGAELLADKFALDMPSIRWTEKNRRIKTLFIEHTLAVTDFMVALEVACRQSGLVRIIEKEELLANSPRLAKG